MGMFLHATSPQEYNTYVKRNNHNIDRLIRLLLYIMLIYEKYYSLNLYDSETIELKKMLYNMYDLLFLINQDLHKSYSISNTNNIGTEYENALNLLTDIEGSIYDDIVDALKYSDNKPIDLDQPIN